MKFFLAIFTIALVAQVSFGASIQRPKRDADDLKEVLSELRSKFVVMAKEIPDTEAYAKYKKSFEDFIQMFGEQNGKYLCFDKVEKIFTTIGEMAEEYKKDESEEATKIKEIIRKYKDVEFEKKLESVADDLEAPALC